MVKTTPQKVRSKGEKKMIFILSIIIAVAVVLNMKAKRHFLRWLFCVIVCLSISIQSILITKKTPVVIAKASDHDWEYAEGMQHIKSDTTITRIVVLDGDTLYPTTHYKVIKRK